nr:MAG TPA: hypothetical protein [Caudoviricetes sp.]
MLYKPIANCKMLTIGFFKNSFSFSLFLISF